MRYPDKAGTGKKNRWWIVLVVICMMMTSLCTGCGGEGSQEGSQEGTLDTSRQTTATETERTLPQEQSDRPDRDGVYDSRDEVALYLYVYGQLPSNYITKNEARDLGWQGGSLEPYAPGKCIGGDHFGNYERQLPEGNYHECDIDTLGADSRGAKRLVYSDEDIYYTGDHYRTFVQLYDEDGEL